MNISSDIACWPVHLFFFFFFNDTATTEIYTLSLHDALPISCGAGRPRVHILVLYPHHGQADESAGFAGVGGCGDALAELELSASCDRPGGVVDVAAGLFVAVSQLAIEGLR